MYALIGLLIGAVAGILIPWSIPSSYSLYVAMGLLAALDSACGGINARIQRRFKLDIFISGFFGNAVIAVFLTYVGRRLGMDLYLAAVVVFGTRLFQNFAEIRRELLTLRQNGNKINQTDLADIEDNGHIGS